MKNEDTTKLEKIKQIIIKAKQTNQINVEGAMFVIIEYINEKKGVDLSNQSFSEMMDIQLMFHAFGFASEYFEKKYTLKVITKNDKYIKDKIHVLKIWF